MSKELTITIDGCELTATEGQYHPGSGLREGGIHIPSLCYYPRLRSTGACRVCVVEVEGGRALMPACATPVERDGTVVHTRNERVLAARRLSVELLLASGNHDCPNCASNGRCELQDLAYELEIEHPRFPMESHDLPFDHSNPMIVRDLNKCVLCGRCVRGCQEVQVNQVIQFGFRGPDTKIVTGGDTDYADSTCVFCGECVQLCPVGAISEKQRMPYGKSFEEETVRSVCTYCGTGCVVNLAYHQRPDRPCDRRRGRGDEPGQPLCEGSIRLRLHPSPGPVDLAPDPGGGILSGGELGRGAETRGGQARGDQGGGRFRGPGRVLVGAVHERRELPVHEVHAGGRRDTERGPMCASLPIRHRGRSDRSLWQRRHDELHRRAGARGCDPAHREQPDGKPSGDRQRDEAWDPAERHEAHRGGSQGHRHDPVCHPLAPAETRVRRGLAERHDARDHRGGAVRQAVCGGADGSVRGSERGREEVHARIRGRDLGYSCEGSRGRRPALRDGKEWGDLLRHGHHPAHHRHGQREEPGKPGHALRQRGDRERGRESALRTEQRAGSVRHGCPPECLYGLPGGGRPGRAEEVRRGLGRLSAGQAGAHDGGDHEEVPTREPSRACTSWARTRW